jgi:hypothetical protein
MTANVKSCATWALGFPMTTNITSCASCAAAAFDRTAANNASCAARAVDADF